MDQEAQETADPANPTPSALRFVVKHLSLDAATMKEALWAAADQLERLESMNGQLIQYVKQYEAQLGEARENIDQKSELISVLQTEQSRLQNEVDGLREEGARDAMPFCTQCAGPFTSAQGADPQYGGHWDTCPNRPRVENEGMLTHADDPYAEPDPEELKKRLQEKLKEKLQDAGVEEDGGDHA